MRREYAQSLFGILLLIGFSLSFGNRAGSVHNGREVRLAYFPNLTHAPVLVAVKDGLYEKRLPGYAVHPFVVNAGPEAMEALLAGDVDVACVGPSPALNTYIKSHGRALRIVAGVCSGGASLVARDGVSVSSVADLNGKRVADPEFGGTQDVSLRHFLKLSGLASREAGGTVEIVSLKNPDILTSLKRGQIDAAWVPEPWASRLVSEARAKRVIDERSLWPGGQFTTSLLVARTDFLTQHPDLVNDIVGGTRDAVTLLNSDVKRGQSDANAEIARLTGKPLKPAVIADAWPRLRFSTVLDRTSLAAFVGAARDAGYFQAANFDLNAACAEPTTVALSGKTTPERLSLR